MKFKQILMTVLLIALSVMTVAAKCTEAQTKAFEKWDHEWSKSSAEGNRAELEKIYADDYEGIGGVNLGANDKKTIIDNAVKNAGSNANVKASSHNYLITCTPNTVTIAHRNTNITTTDGKESTSWSRTIHVLENRKGSWQVVSSVSHGVNGDGASIFSRQLDSDQALMKRDVDWFRKNVADDFVGTLPNGTVYTKAQMIGYFENVWKDPKDSIEFMRLSDIQIRVDGNMGFMTGVHHSKGIGNDGKPFERKSRFNNTLVKRDGSWTLIASASANIGEE